MSESLKCIISNTVSLLWFLALAKEDLKLYKLKVN